MTATPERLLENMLRTLAKEDGEVDAEGDESDVEPLKGPGDAEVIRDFVGGLST